MLSISHTVWEETRFGAVDFQEVSCDWNTATEHLRQRLAGFSRITRESILADWAQQYSTVRQCSVHVVTGGSAFGPEQSGIRFSYHG